jgi:hypothetical protein
MMPELDNLLALARQFSEALDAWDLGEPGKEDPVKWNLRHAKYFADAAVRAVVRAKEAQGEG